MSSPIVSVRDVARSFRDGDGEAHALRGVSLTLRAGEFVALMGASGSGKTTLLNIIAGIDKATSGSVKLLGRDLSTSSLRRVADLRLRHVGYVFQNINLLPDLSLLENVALPLEAMGTRKALAATEAQRRLDEVGVGRLGHRFPGEVSGGERQRAAIARAVVGERSLLLADEPTGALDSETGDAVLSTIRTVCANGVCALVSTHNPVVGAAADRLITIGNGELVSDTQLAGDKRNP